MVQIFDEIGITASEAGTLFQLLDEDQSGDLEVEEFLSGCFHLMQSSTGLDMKVLLYETRCQRKRLAHFMSQTQHRLHDLSKDLRKFAKSANRQPAMPAMPVMPGVWKHAGALARAASKMNLNLSPPAPAQNAAAPQAESNPTKKAAAMHDHEHAYARPISDGATMVGDTGRSLLKSNGDNQRQRKSTMKVSSRTMASTRIKNR